MSERYVVVVTVGPVSTFIGAGRRSRDLWYGSQWVSTLTAEVSLGAETEAGQRGWVYELVTPLPLRINAIRGASRPIQYRAAVPNKLVALVRRLNTATAQPIDDAALRSLLIKARERGAAWFADDLRRSIEARARWSPGLIVQEALDLQLDALRDRDFIEFYAAWQPYPDDDQPELDARRATALNDAWALVGARKGTREFRFAASEDGRPKSDLDPGRDSILNAPGPDSVENLRELRLAAGVREGEQLDAIGLGRRLALFKQIDEPFAAQELPPFPFPPLSRVTADPWLRGLHERGESDPLDAIVSAFRASEAKERNDRIALFAIASRATDNWGTGGASLFGYDGSLLFEGGVDATRAELGLDKLPAGVREIADDLLKEIAPFIRDLRDVAGYPQPYYALLHFDGDGLGSILSKLPWSEIPGSGIREVVRRLDDFADQAAVHIATEARGCAFYVGGDEGMAYLPLDRALGAVRELDRLFRTLVGDYVNSLLNRLDTNFQLDRTSLSLAVVIAHFKFDLRVVRKAAEEALREAKRWRRMQVELAGADPDARRQSLRGCLRIVEMPRGATDRGSTDYTTPAYLGVAPDDQPVESRGLVRRVENWIHNLEGDELGMSIAHGLAALEQRFRDKDKASGDAGLILAHALVKQKQTRKGRVTKSLAQFAKLAKSWDDIRSLYHELQIANTLAASYRQSNSLLEVAVEVTAR